MGITASDIIALAQNTKALSKEQLARILELAPTMTSADLENLKRMIENLRKSDLEAMQKELVARQNIGAKYKEFKSDQDRNKRTNAEEADRTLELQNLSTIIK